MCRSTVAVVVGRDGPDAIVAFDGVRRRASAVLMPDVAVGESVLIGLGVVLGRVSDADVDALRALEADRPIVTPFPPVRGGPQGVSS